MYELRNWSVDFADVSAQSYMRGYRDIYKDVSFFHKLMIKFCDGLVKMQIIKKSFDSANVELTDVEFTELEETLNGLKVYGHRGLGGF